MKAIMAAIVAGLFVVTAHAQDGPTPEQQRLSDCNALANKEKVYRFSDRKPFVDACMRGEKPTKTAAKKAEPRKTAAKQDKSQVCSKQASDRKLKGDDRKKYMNQCTKA